MVKTAKTPSILGGILLVIGNVVGAGILALPIAMAQLGLPCAILLLLFFWLLMMLGALYFLEANLAVPAGGNLISMSRIALGKWGMILAALCNLLVMYSLIAAYISGGGDLVEINFHYLGWHIPSWAGVILFLSFFGWVVSRGIRITDHTNRILMLIKAAIFFAILGGLLVHFNFLNIPVVPQRNVSGSLFIIAITSFGFATLVPSLRQYYQSDVQKIQKIIFWGTSIPLLCYIAWITLILSALPYEGDHGLQHMAKSAHPVSDLQLALNVILHSRWLSQATNFFSSICIITSFLANSISLTDFIADGLKAYNKPFLVYVLAYLPALIAVLFYPKAFLLGLSVAGSLAVVQLLILPAVIVWCLRNSAEYHADYRVFGGELLLWIVLIVSFEILLSLYL